MSSDGQHVPDATNPNRRRLLIVGLIVLALLVFGGGYVLGKGGGNEAATTPTQTPSPTASTEPGPTESESKTASGTTSPAASALPTGEPGDVLTDGRYFVRLTDIQGGEEGPLQLQYDLAYFLTGDAANEAAAERGLETPVPNDSLIINDSHRLRLTPLADVYGVKYIPEGTCCDLVKAHEAQFLEWMGETNQTDFPPKDAAWWWITIANGEVTKIQEQYLA
jgi:hypothetical protein